MKRESGYYWCKYTATGLWKPVRYSSEFFKWANDGYWVNDDYWDIINEQRIKTPDEN